LVVAGLGLASCGGIRHQPAPQPIVATVAVPAVPGPAPDPGAADINRKLAQVTVSVEEESDLPLGPGDLIEVSVFDVQELSGLKLRISNSGSITLPLIGVVPAAGLSAVELQDSIRARLQEKYMHDPQVSLFIHEHKSQRITVVGAVRTAGVFTLTSRLSLADALAMAGGIADDAGPSVYVIRRVPSHLVAAAPANGDASGPAKDQPAARTEAATEPVMTAIDLESLAAGKQELNLPLQAGDVVEVPRAKSFYVGGEVNRPGSFPLKSHTTLDQVPALIGGLKDPADWDDVRVYRPRADGTREILTFSLNEFEKGKPAPEIQSNDIVVVGKSNLKAFLYGVKDFFRFSAGASLPIPVQ